MKTVIQVVQHLRPGGIESIALDLASFTQANEKVLIVSLEGDIDSAIAHWPKLAPYREQLIFLDKQAGHRPAIVAKLVKLFKRNHVAAVHTHHIGPLLYAGLAARLASVPYLIHTEHDAWHLNNNKRCLLQRGAIKVLNPTLVADAKTVANHMQAKLKVNNKITVIHNGIDSDRFKPGNKLAARETLGLPDKVRLIGCSGRMETVKGQSVLIEALSILPLNVHLALAGDGSTEAALRQLVSELDLVERVHFLGHLDSMPTFYQSLDLFCLPSLNEGFPLSPLEAQACDIKTLVTDVGASRETLCPDSGHYVIANNSNAMATKIIGMLSSQAKWHPRQFVKTHGDVNVMAKAYANLRQPAFTIGG